MQTSRNLRNSDRDPGTVEKRISVSESSGDLLSRSFKTNVLRQEFSMTYSQNKAETTFIPDSVGN